MAASLGADPADRPVGPARQGFARVGRRARLPDDRGPGGRHLGAVGGARPTAEARGHRGALPLRPLPRDRPQDGAGGSLDAWTTLAGARRRDRADPARNARLAGDVPARRRAGEERRHGRPHLGRPRRARHRRRLVRGGARRVRLPVPDRARAGGAADASSSRRSCATGREDERMLPKPVQQPHPPLIVGGSGKPGTVEPAVRWADEYNTTGASPEACRERREALDRACERAGRDPATLPLSLMRTCIVGSRRGRPPRARCPLRRALPAGPLRGRLPRRRRARRPGRHRRAGRRAPARVRAGRRRRA